MPRAKDAAASTFSLTRFVDDVRVLEPVAGRASRIDRLADGRTTLCLRLLDGGRKGDVTVAGPRTQALLKTTAGVARVVILRFKAGWSAPLFGVAADALTDRFVPLEDLWGRSGGALSHELLAARSLPEALDRLSDAFVLRSRDAVEPASARLARRAVRLLEAGDPCVESVASQLGVTARHLRRAFVESVGVAPKHFARSVRVRRAVQMAETSGDWARIAADAGYYDQAHLIADFRELVGLTPAAFLERAAAVDSAAALCPRLPSERRQTPLHVCGGVRSGATLAVER